MRGDQGGTRRDSGPRQRSAVGHEAWLLSGAWSLVLSRLAIQGHSRSIQGFGPLSLHELAVYPVGFKSGGARSNFYWTHVSEG